MLGGEVAVQGHVQLAQLHLHGRGVGLVAHVGEHEVHVVARRAHAVVHGVPRRGPHERAGQRLLEVSEVGGGRGQ